MMRTLIILFVFNLIISAGTNRSEYRVNNIFPSLLKDANAVVRKDETVFTVKSESKAVKTVRLAVTIFNQDGRGFGELELDYDRFIKIKDIEGIIYDADGVFVKELDSDQIKDYSAISNGTLFEDSRIKKIEFYHQKFPYTVEFYYELEYNGYLQWPKWVDQSSLDAVESSKFSVIIPEEMKLRYWCSKDSVKPTINKVDDEIHYLWNSLLLEKLSSDVYGDDYEDFATVVCLAPAKFEIDGTGGDLTTWKSFGTWVHNLFTGKSKLSKKAVDEIKTLQDSTRDVYKKIDVLYKYLQGHTRYISVQLGIGAWQPFDASFVYEHGYGDCKALSNYMTVLLKQAGLNAYPVLIRNGRPRFTFLNDFPNQMFNHVIVCVPLQKDTVWIECTSSTANLGEIGSSNENRYALMITPEGGVVVKTPSSNHAQNMQVRNCYADINLTGELVLNSEVKWTGNQAKDIYLKIKDEAGEEKENWIARTISVPGISIQNYQFIKKESDKNFALKLSAKLPRYSSINSNRIFFQPNVMERRSSVPADVTKRFSPIRFGYPYSDIDTIKFKLPDGYAVETLPQTIELTKPFGKFSSKSVLGENNTIIYSRYYELNVYSIQPGEYNEYRKFIQSVVASDRAKVVLVRK
jgi:hypothetical protein